MANTEAFHRLNAFHETFDGNIKVTFGCLEKLRTFGPRKSGKLIELPTGDEPWGKSIPIRDPGAPASKAIHFISTMGIVRVIAAMKDYLTTLEAEFSRTAFMRQNDCKMARPASETGWAGLPLTNTSSDLGMPLTTIQNTLPLYKYFTIARNCIVHRSGRASDELVEIASSQEVLSNHANWKTNKGTRLPALPLVTLGKEIPWQPRHAVLSMAVCYQAARQLDVEVTQRIGISGLIYMAAYHSILAADRIVTNTTKSPDRMIATILDNRYRQRRTPLHFIVSELKAMGKWEECYRAFNRMQSVTS